MISAATGCLEHHRRDLTPTPLEPVPLPAILKAKSVPCADSAGVSPTAERDRHAELARLASNDLRKLAPHWEGRFLMPASILALVLAEVLDVVI